MTIKEISKAFGGRVVGTIRTKLLICEAVSFLEAEMIDYVTKKVWFFSSSDDAWGYTFDGNDLNGKHLIFLSDELFSQDKIQILYTILHEIGHVIRKHKNSIHLQQTQSEIKMQELEADRFAKTYLNSNRAS